jgi:hypothetical protein
MRITIAQAKWQKLKLDNIKEWKIVSLLSLDKKQPIRFSTLNCCEALRHTLSYADQDYNTLINVLEKESSILIEWFNFNCMQANPDKFQVIDVGKKTYAKEPVFNI